jgi:DNA-binding transcriptional LysR family regulator
MGGTTPVDLNQMLLFVRVVQAGSFSAAARAVGVPKSTLSRKVSELEERLGARLLQRTTRTLAVTDAGRIYFDHAARVVAEAYQAERAVTQMQAAPRGLLRVTAPMSFSMLAPIVSEYVRTYPDVELELVCTDRRVDLVDDGFDLAIRAGPLSDSTLVARPLDALTRILVAAPSYCKEQGVPKTPPDLQRHACIVFGAGPDPALWALQSKAERLEVRVTPRLTVNDLEILRTGMLDGLGIAWVPAFICADDVRAGRLRHILPAWGSEEIPLHAVYPTARHLSPKVSAFLDLLRAKLRLRV